MDAVIKTLISTVVFPLQEQIKGHTSVALRRELERTQWLSAAQIAELQTSKLRVFLERIGASVPYYRQLFAASGFNPRTVRSIDDLMRLPVISKSEMRAHGDAMRASDSGKLKRFSTGGSTGEPLTFYLGRSRISHDVAAKWRATRWWGVDIGDKEIALWGSPIESGRQDRLRALRDRVLRSTFLPAFRMSDSAMDGYLSLVAHNRPKMLFGYASSLALLAQHARARGRDMTRCGIRVAFATGETLYPTQRAVITEAFGCPVANGYGSREGGFIAHECPHGGMHLCAEDVVVELLDESGQRVPPGKPGEIVVTHLATPEFPFVRYRTGDIGVMSEESCSCGRGLPTFSQVLGRSTDFVRTRSGNVMHALALIYEVRDQPGVAAFKFVQSEDLAIELQIVAGPLFTPEVQQRILTNLAKRLESGCPITVKLLAEIPPERSGKHRYVVSHALPAGGGVDAAADSQVGGR